MDPNCHSKRLNILLVEDDELFSMGVVGVLRTYGQVRYAQKKEEAFDLMAKEGFDCAFIDMDLDGRLDGLSILQRARDNGIYTVVLSSHEAEEVINKAYANGARDYIPKLNYRIHLERAISDYLESIGPNHLTGFIKRNFLTSNTKTLKEILNIGYLKGNKKNVFITGPSGVGKGIIAKMIHDYQKLPKEKFVAINCSALSSGLLESELFGHEKGAFTGATDLHRGKLELANGGTLFLDEVATMGSDIQVKLLKAIEEKVFYRVGGTKPIEANFRVVSATWENIFELMEKGKFRQDLYYRLTGLTIDIPPLNQRIEDIWPLINQFMKNEGRMLAFSVEAKTILEEYPWPGNVRELKKLVEILCVTKKSLVSEADLRKLLLPSKMKAENSELILNPSTIGYIEKVGLPQFILDVEKVMVKRIFKSSEGKVRKVLERLKISSTTYYRIMKSC